MYMYSHWSHCIYNNEFCTYSMYMYIHVHIIPCEFPLFSQQLPSVPLGPAQSVSGAVAQTSGQCESLLSGATWSTYMYKDKKNWIWPGLVEVMAYLVVREITTWSRVGQFRRVGFSWDGCGVCMWCVHVQCTLCMFCVSRYIQISNHRRLCSS